MDYKNEFFKQLKYFKQDRSYFNDYDWLDITSENNHPKILTRMFKMDLGEGIKSKILIPDPVTGEMKTKDKVITNSIRNIGIVIKSNSKNYKEGDLVYLPASKVFGEDYNPDFITAYSLSNSNLEPILPEGFRKKLPMIEINYKDKKIVLPWNKIETEFDQLTYLFDEYDILSSYKL